MAIFLSALFIVVCVLLIIVVLLQKGRGGGLGAALGGGAGSSAFGTKTGDVFTWVTIVLTGLFLLLAIASTVVFRPPPEVISSPVLDPQPAPIARETVISMYVPGAKDDVEIRYTLDGTTPNDRSAQYVKNPVRIAPGTTVTATAFKRGRNSRPTVGEYPKEGAQPATSTMPASAAAPTAPASAPAP